MVPKDAASPLDAMPPADMRRALHELRVHQIELEMQNEELRRAQVDLEAARARYFDLYDLAPVGYVTVSETGLIQQANLTAMNMLGVTRSTLLNRPLSHFVLKNDQYLYYQQRKQLLASAEAQNFELRLLKPDGTILRMHLMATVAPNAEGVKLSYIVLTDITQRKRAEEALRESGASVHAFFANPQFMQGIVEVVDGDILHVHDNVTAAQFFGRTVEEMHQARASEMGFAPETVRGWIAHYEESQRTNLPVDFEYCHGESQNVRHLRVVVTHLGKGSFGPRFTYAVEDDSHRWQAKMELKDSQVRFADLAKQSRTVVWDVDAQGLYTHVSSVAEAAWGYHPEELVGRLHFYDLHPEAGREEFKQAAFAIFARRESVANLENAVLHKDGRVVWVSTNGIPVLNPDGSLGGYRGSDVDITDRKQAEARRLALEAQLHQAQKLESVGRLAGGVAHDFNNLLTGIINYAELCRDGLPSEHPVRGYLDEITADAQRSAAITQQLLAFARKQAVAPKVLDLNDTLAGMLKMLRHLIGEDIAVNWMPGTHLWPVKIDPGQIDQILANLCVNARDAIAGVGKVAIETMNTTFDNAYCAAHADTTPGEYVGLAVGDTGCGMSKDVLDHIFEPFFTTKVVGKGTGLGLATVYGIVEQSHGHIAVQSEVGKGTTFRIYLPRAAREPETAAVTVAPVELPRGTETILVAEDEKSVRVIVRLFLEALGYTVLAAATPEEAQRLAGAHVGPIHLLITDVIMPGMNGPDLAERLAEERPKLRCLLMSGYTADVLAHRGTLGEGMPFLSKPFFRDGLARKVREVLDGD